MAQNGGMSGSRPPRIPFDTGAYVRRVQLGPCFVCAVVAGDPDYQHHLVFEDESTISFLVRNPTLLGYCLVAPKRHVESWVHGLDEADFLALQQVAYRVAHAVSAAVPTERMYSMSLGSQQGNAHVHWHLAPLPPGVPYSEQQYHALMAENGVLDVDDEGQAALAKAIHRNLR